MLFRRVKLREARSQNVGLPVVPPSRCGTLFDLIVDKPNFGPVAFRRVAEEDDLEKRFVGFELDWMMELGNEWTQFLEEGNADLLEVLLGATRGSETRVDSTKMGDVAVEPNGLGLGGDLPFGSAEENGDVAAINGRNARGNGFGFERVIDGGKHNGVIGYMNDGAAAGEIGDDFVFLGMGRSAGRECGQKNQGGANEEIPHGGRVAQRADCGLEAVIGMVPEQSRIR